MPNRVQLTPGATVSISPNSPYFPSYKAKVGEGDTDSTRRIFTHGEFCKVWSVTAQGYSDGLVVFFFYDDGTMEVWALPPPGVGHTIYTGTWAYVT